MISPGYVPGYLSTQPVSNAVPTVANRHLAITNGEFYGVANMVPGNPSSSAGAQNNMVNRLDHVFDLGVHAWDNQPTIGPDFIKAREAFWNNTEGVSDAIIQGRPLLDADGITNEFYSSESGFTQPQLPIQNLFQGVADPTTYTMRPLREERKMNTRVNRRTNLHPAGYDKRLFNDTTAMDMKFPENTWPLFSYMGKFPSSDCFDTGEIILSLADVNERFARVANSPLGRFQEDRLFGWSFRNPTQFLLNWQFVGWNTGVEGTDHLREKARMFTDLSFGVIRSYNWWIGHTTTPPVNGASLYLAFRREEIPANWSGPLASKRDEELPLGDLPEVDDAFDPVSHVIPQGLGGMGDMFPTVSEWNGHTIPKFSLLPDVDISHGVSDPFIDQQWGPGRQLPRLWVGNICLVESVEQRIKEKYQVRVRNAVFPVPTLPRVSYQEIQRFPWAEIYHYPNRFR